MKGLYYLAMIYNIVIIIAICFLYYHFQTLWCFLFLLALNSIKTKNKDS